MNGGTYLPLGNNGHPEDGVVRIINLHYGADIDDNYEFFGEDLTIVGFIRSINTKMNTVGYAPFTMKQERVNAQALSDGKILNREVKFLPVQDGFCSM